MFDSTNQQYDDSVRTFEEQSFSFEKPPGQGPCTVILIQMTRSVKEYLISCIYNRVLRAQIVEMMQRFFKNGPAVAEPRKRRASRAIAITIEIGASRPMVHLDLSS